MEILSILGAIFILGIISVLILAFYILAWPKIQTWATDSNGKIIRGRIPAVTAYFLLLIFILGSILYAAILP